MVHWILLDPTGSYWIPLIAFCTATWLCRSVSAAKLSNQAAVTAALHLRDAQGKPVLYGWSSQRKTRTGSLSVTTRSRTPNDFLGSIELDSGMLQRKGPLNFFLVTALFSICYSVLQDPTMTRKVSSSFELVLFFWDSISPLYHLLAPDRHTGPGVKDSNVIRAKELGDRDSLCSNDKQNIVGKLGSMK